MKNDDEKNENAPSQSEFERGVILQNSLKTLREMKDVQCNDGNWNYDPYMHGMANGMIFALSLFDDKQPEYLDPPKVWLKDLPDSEVIAVEEAAR